MTDKQAVLAKYPHARVIYDKGAWHVYTGEAPKTKLASSIFRRLVWEKARLAVESGADAVDS